MAQELNINKHDFIAACESVNSVDDLMQEFNLSRDQVKYLRKRLKEKGHKLKKLKPKKVEKMSDDWSNHQKPSPWEVVKTKFIGRLSHCDKIGYKLDGKKITVQQLIAKANF